MIANVNTSETAILGQIVTELQAITGLNAGTVFIAAIPLFLEAPPGDQYLEVVPGAALDVQAKQGTGHMADTFTVCVFRRLWSDEAGRDTARIADSTRGLLALIDAVDAKMIASYLKGLALVPILPERREAGERNPQDPADGWIMMKRQYKVEYLYSFPSAQSTS
jgi:hypothetical protein